MIGKTSQTGRLLKLLKKHKRLTNRQIMQTIGAFSYTRRISDLRDEGHIIVAQHIKDGLWEYIYKGLNDEALLDKHLKEVRKNPERFDKRLMSKIKSWL